MLIKSIKILIILFSTLTLSACGGGDGDSNTYKEQETELAPDPDPNPIPNNIDPKLKVTINCPSNGTDSGYIDLVVDGTGTGSVIITVEQDDTQRAAGKSYSEFTLINGTVSFDTTDRDSIQEIEEQHVSAGETYRFQFIDLNTSNFDCKREEMRVLTNDDVVNMQFITVDDIDKVCLYDTDDKGPNHKKFCNALISISSFTNDP